MKTIATLKQDVRSITMKINREYPELSKYMVDIPMKESNNPQKGLGNEVLSHYYDSLVDLLAEYTKTHVVSTYKTFKKEE